MIRGLNNLIDDDSWRHEPPTKKQLDYLREDLGDKAVDKLIKGGLTRGEAADIIDENIDVKCSSDAYYGGGWGWNIWDFIGDD